MNSMGANASTSPPSTRPRMSSPNNVGSPLDNAVDTSNDTDMLTVPGGILESNGPNTMGAV